MRSAHRQLVQILLATITAFIAVGARAAGDHCQADALEKWYCAIDPRGTAVVDNLGRVVCAPGACVKQDAREPDEREWWCASTPGGSATATPKRPVCEGGCRLPEATQCKKL
ncbi:MAG TPA: hypothetical protein VKH41_00605 [Myxococcota bacterium]|nr:hypothetical protein [Myxococcota bacterium]